ncbi:Uncharacterised protein [Shigella sonnei]|nr:Uncharacterised protein [Shigella sonnei]
MEGEKSRVGKGRGKRNDRRFATGLQHIKNISVDIDCFISSDWNDWRFRHFYCLWRNVITRLRSCDNISLTFEQLIGMADSHKAHA